MSNADVALVIVLVNSVGVIACSVMIALLARRHRRNVDEITELQAAVDSILLGHDMPPFFAARYDIEIVPDPQTRQCPPDEPAGTGGAPGA